MEENSKIISAEDVETQQVDSSVPDKYNIFLTKNNNRPCKARCESCKTTTITFMKKSYNAYSFVFAFLIFHVYGFLYGLPLILIIIPLCQNITHECPNCGTILLVDKFCNIKLQENNVPIFFFVIKKLFHFIIEIRLASIRKLYFNIQIDLCLNIHCFSPYLRGF